MDKGITAIQPNVSISKLLSDIRAKSLLIHFWDLHLRVNSPIDCIINDSGTINNRIIMKVNYGFGTFVYKLLLCICALFNELVLRLKRKAKTNYRKLAWFSIEHRY